MWIAEYSLPRAKERLDRAKEYYASMPEPQRKARYQEYIKTLRVSLPLLAPSLIIGIINGEDTAYGFGIGLLSTNQLIVMLYLA